MARNVVCKLGNKLGSLRLTEEIEISLLKRLVGRGRATADRNENLHPTGMSLCDQSFILPLERWWRKKSALPVLEWVEIEASQEQEDACAVMLEVTKASGRCLEGLDGRVKGFGHGVSDAVLAVLPQAAQVLFERGGDFLDRPELAAPRLLIPLGKVTLRLKDVFALPELKELEAVIVSSRRTQVLPGQRLEGFKLLPTEFRRVPQPEVAAAFEPFITPGAELLVLGAAHLIHGFA